MTTTPQNQGRRLLTAVGVSSVAAAFLNVGTSALDHPRAFEDPLALAPAALAATFVFLACLLPLALVCPFLGRRLACQPLSLMVGAGTAACALGALAPLIEALARGTNADTAPAAWGLGAAAILAVGVSGFLLSERIFTGAAGRFAFPIVDAGEAAAVLAAEICFFVWFHENRMGIWETHLARAAMVGFVAVLLATPLALSRLSPIGPGATLGVLVALLSAGSFFYLHPSEDPSEDMVAKLGTISDEAPRAVVLLTVDTLRPDMISGRTKGPVETPAFAELAEDSVVFEAARSPAPWTKPSMASIMTGLSPAVHGMTNRRARLSNEIETLAESLKQAGYHTAGFGLNAHLEPLFQFRQGFDDYAFPARADWGLSIGAKVLNRLDPHRFPERFPSTTAIADVASDWVAKNHRHPFFLWMHVLDPHWPYEPPVEWMPDAHRQKPHPRFGFSWGDPETVTNVQAGNTKLGPEDREYVRDLYKAEVRYADWSVGRVIGELKRAGVYDDALIVLASDHGEEFWEHGRFEHGHTLYDEVLRVPLFFKLPQAASRKALDVAVSTESVTPTVLDVVGVDFDRTRYSAPSLAGHWLGDLSTPNMLFSTGTYYHGEKEAVVFDGLKLIVDKELGRVELYDLARDPGEETNIASGSPHVVKGRNLLDRWREDAAAMRERLGIKDDVADLDGSVNDAMKALGYAGSH